MLNHCERLISPRLFSAYCFLILTILLSGCQNVGTPNISERIPTIVLTPTPDQSAYWKKWENGPHADTYNIEKGPNTYCAKCHSPTNWDYSATIDPPPNCVSCKFSFEPQPRVAQGNLFVPADEWRSIGCNVCHRVENGISESEITWFNQPTGYYETVTTSTELCEKCHKNTESLQHKRELGNGAHADFTCTECHDAHETGANCNNCHLVSMSEMPKPVPEHQEVTRNIDCDECHAGAFESHTIQIQETENDDCMDCHEILMGVTTLVQNTMGHSQIHITLSCVVCHDGSGLEVGPIEGQAAWITFRATELLGRLTNEPYQSHDIQREVNCARCHYPDNPWGIVESVSEFEQ